MPECTAPYAACGCDGKNHASECVALAQQGAQAGLIGEGFCPAPAGEFACVYDYQVPIYCDVDTEYCRVQFGPEPYGQDCVPLEGGCAPAPGDQCQCADPRCSVSYCAVGDDGAMTVFCDR